MAKKYKSKISESMHRTITGLHKVGIVGKKTMRAFDVMCLNKVEPPRRRPHRRLA